MDGERIEAVWFHSHEEDEGDRLVFRSADFDFPRARAPRESLTFDHSGTVSFGAPGPADAPAFRDGSWQLDGDVLTLASSSGDEEFRVEALDEDRMVLRRMSRGKVDRGEDPQGREEGL